MLPCDEDRNQAHGVNAGNLVDVADEVAGHGLEEADGAAGTLDDADFSDFLARRLAVPEGLKEREVAPVEEEEEEDRDGCEPLRGELVEGGKGRNEENKQEDEHPEGDAPEQRVDEDGDEPAAEAGERHLDLDQLGGIDAVLIWIKPVRT